jgi:hypothetical protein
MVHIQFKLLMLFFTFQPFSVESTQEGQRKKAALMLLTLVVVFFISNLPVHLFNTLM